MMYKEETYYLKPTTTSRETLYTCPANKQSRLIGFIMTNSNLTTNQVMKVEHYDSSTSTYNVLFHKTVGKTDSVFYDTSFIILDPSDLLVLTAGSENAITCAATFEEKMYPKGR